VLRRADKDDRTSRAPPRCIDRSLVSHGEAVVRPCGAVKYRPSLRKDGVIRRGVSSSSDQACGNLHTIAAPLRAAVYAKLGEAGATEEMLVWDRRRRKVSIGTNVFNSALLRTLPCSESRHDCHILTVCRSPYRIGHSVLGHRVWLSHNTAMAYM
jgi:hypothetical protein